MKLLILATAILISLPLAAQPAATQTEPPKGYASIIPLWPAGQVPFATGSTDGDTPRLFAYPAADPGPHPVVLVMPGGGYTHLAIDKEGGNPARWLAAHGVSAYVLEYRLSPAYRWPVPQIDASRAVRYLRAHAAELALDPTRLGVWGFSAGGHLSAYLSTTHTAGNPAAADPLDRQSDRPDFAILSYGRLDLSDAVPRPPATKDSPGMEIVLGATVVQIDILPRVSRDTSPTFLYSTTGDQTVNSLNDTNYYAALKRIGVPAELHIFELGAHGTGLADNASPTPTPAPQELAIWPTLLAHWMQQNHWMP
jgi:acetyl esterase/lipase